MAEAAAAVVEGLVEGEGAGESWLDGMMEREAGSKTATSRYRRRSCSAKAARKTCDIWRNSSSASSARISAMGGTSRGVEGIELQKELGSGGVGLGLVGVGGWLGSSKGSSLGSVLGIREVSVSGGGGESGRRFRSINGIVVSIRRRKGRREGGEREGGGDTDGIYT